MKKILAVICLLALGACEFSNEHGKCIGIAATENPKLNYEVSVWNTVWSAIFIESLFPPVLWVLSYAKCPTGPKTNP